MIKSSFSLIDDGTMDTVIRCDKCGEEIRFTAAECNSDSEEDGDTYDNFVQWCIEECEDDHVCDTVPDDAVCWICERTKAEHTDEDYDIAGCCKAIDKRRFENAD